MEGKNHLILAAILAAVSITGTSNGATIAFAGSDLDVAATVGPPPTTDFWRTTSVAKPNDIDGDDVLGTDGYRYVRRGPNPDIQSSLPSYFTSSTLTGNHFGGNTSYAVIDAGTVAPGATVANQRSGTFNPGVGSASENLWVDFGSVDFNRNAAPGETVRVALMVDNLDNTNFNSSALRLSTGGVDTDVNIFFPTTGTGAHRGNRNPDWYYWDITNFSNGDTIQFSATSSHGNGSTSRPATIGAFAFDSIIPEPSRVTLLGLGVIALILRRRR